MEYCIKIDEVKTETTGGHHQGGTIKRVINYETINTERMRVAIQEYTPGGHTSLHSHDSEEQAFYILEGKMKVSVNGKEYIAEPGDIVFTPRGTTHSYENATDGKLVFMIIVAQFDAGKRR